MFRENTQENKRNDNYIASRLHKCTPFEFKFFFNSQLRTEKKLAVDSDIKSLDGTPAELVR